MLSITIPGREFYDERRQEFVKTKDVSLSLEHSLVSVSKWESKWKKPFLAKNEKTREELADYIRCMTLTQNISPDTYLYIPDSVYNEAAEYIGDNHSATRIKDSNTAKSRSGEAVTSELIYYWMIANSIPLECQKWHLERLLILIRICGIKNNPPKKMSKQDTLNQYRALNAARRKK